MYVNLSEACLSDEEKRNVDKTLIKHKDTFCPRNKIGQCPNLEVGLNDKTTFSSHMSD